MGVYTKGSASYKSAVVRTIGYSKKACVMGQYNIYFNHLISQRFIQNVQIEHISNR